MQKQSYLTVTDQFCGAGGSSQGVRNFANRIGGGVEVKLALNHWKLAIETHNTNFQDTLHDCTDISACDPRRYPSTDILITSPECTNHSLAKGQKAVKAQLDAFESGRQDAAAERSRATMWDVCRFSEYHRYNAIIVENVVDARKWLMFDAWLNAMHVLGYNHKCVYLNSMHCHPTPQSRDRMYIVFWRKGNKAPNLEYQPLAWCPCCERNVNAIQVWKNPDKKFGKYKTQYVYKCPKDGITVEPYYYAAFNCIDWSDPGKRIGDRERPLSPNTVTRIQHGLDKYGDRELIITTKFHSERIENGARSAAEALRTQCGEQAHGVLSPFLVDDKQTTGIGCRVRSAAETINTLHGDPRVKMVMPFIMKGEHALQEGYVKPVTGSLQGQTTRQSMAMVVPYIIEMNKTGECKPATNAASTVTAGGTNHAVLQAPLITISRGESKSHSSTESMRTQSQCINHGIVTPQSFNNFLLAYNYRGNQVSHITEPCDTQTASDRISLVSYNKPKIEDCFYRMLKPHEVKLAMAFEKDYIVLGSGKDQVKQCGNAVTPPAMEWLVAQVAESLM